MTGDDTADEGATGGEDRADQATDSSDAGELAIEYDWTTIGRPSLGVVTAVAATTGRDATEMPPLQRFVDAGALDALLTGERARSAKVTASFSYDGYEVVVDWRGTVRLAIEADDEQSK